MFILIMSVVLLAWLSRDTDDYSDICSLKFLFLCRGIILIAVWLPLWGYADPWFFPISAWTWDQYCIFATWVEISIAPLRLVSRHRCAVLRFDLLFGVSKGFSQVSPITVLSLMIAPGSSQFVCI